MVIIQEEDYLAHYGILRRSGRYPWGSGDNAYQRSTDMLAMFDDLKKQGLSDKQIIDSFSTPDHPLTTADYRAMRSIAKNRKRAGDIAQAERLKEKGYSNVAIGERMGINESSVRALLAPGAKTRADALTTTANLLRDEVEAKGYIDVGTGVEKSAKLGVSRTRLNTAVKMLEEEGYELHRFAAPQVGQKGQFTKMKVLGKKDSDWQEVVRNQDLVKQIDAYSEDGGKTYEKLGPPKPVSSSRIKVNYAEDGGADADGVIYVRPGVEDLSLGRSRYAQVRINVDDTHFLKGMAIYKDDLPDGVDLAFNTNKSKKDVVSKKDAFKEMKRTRDGDIDWDNPFGSSVTRQRGAMNILQEEGDWLDWRDTIASQVLSKQSPVLAKSQLDMRYERFLTDLDDIKALTNPAVKRQLLKSLADSADSSASHLEAAAMPRQKWHVILPVNSLKDNEIYAPNYDNGERVALIRYPHGGTFEIPELTVNNKNGEARKSIGAQSIDAVGINSKVAKRLSGADFDGDTVLVIPNDKGKIKSSPALQGLKNFDPQTAYPGYEGMRKMSSGAKQKHMGDVSNLITDMTIKGANQSEIARAVRHSMVVIDAEKHGLNYRQSYQDNAIGALKEKYQGKVKGGASTLISRAGSETRIPARKPRPASEGGPIDKKTGKKVFVETGETYVNSKGQTVKKMERGSFRKLALVDDAHELSSGTRIEEIYADHSNKMKALANEARREMVHTNNIPVSTSAKRVYSKEVADLNAKLDRAIRQRPLERQAQLIAKANVEAKKKARPDLDADDIKKIERQALQEARNRTGASRVEITFTPNEWEAVQAGAISNNKLEQMLARADLDQVKELATPRSRPKMTPLKIVRAQNMAAAGFTQAEIASQLGVAPSTISTTLREEEF